jgi:succinyl-diaminopimelate desuccinylase
MSALHPAALHPVDAVALTQALVRIPSVNRPEEGLSEAKAAAFVAEWMRGRGWEPLVEEVAPGRPNVVCLLEGDAPGPTLLFEGHTDVVTEGDRAEWEWDPFGGEIVDGVLWGRGSADTKGGLAAMLVAAALLDETRPFPGRVVLAVLADEEGMMLGAKGLVAAGHVRGVDAAIICEPEAGEVCLSQKGAIRVALRAEGRMAHGAMPERGANPLPALARATAAALQLQDELQARHGADEHLGLPYITPTVLRAGDQAQVNVIPAAGMLMLDVRTTPAVDHAELLERLRAVADAASGKGVRLGLEVIDDRPATVTPPDAPVVRALMAAHRAVTGEEACVGGVPGTTDGTILWRDAGIPVVIYGPGGKWIAHQANEHVTTEEIVMATRVYLEAARRFLTGELDG